jgi:endonuclease/exonuclease/phosphatase family metal-dependent hydrolase
LLIIRKIKEIVGDQPAVLTGDFNVTDASEAYNTIVSNEFVLLDAHKVAEKTTGASYTFHGFDKVDMEKRSKIDFVFVTPNIKVLQSEVTKEVKEALLSDHNPQWTDLEF